MPTEDIIAKAKRFVDSGTPGWTIVADLLAEIERLKKEVAGAVVK